MEYLIYGLVSALFFNGILSWGMGFRLFREATVASSFPRPFIPLLLAGESLVLWILYTYLFGFIDREFLILFATVPVLAGVHGLFILVYQKMLPDGPLPEEEKNFPFYNGFDGLSLFSALIVFLVAPTFLHALAMIGGITAGIYCAFIVVNGIVRRLAVERSVGALRGGALVLLIGGILSMIMGAVGYFILK
ncbi:MAG TPA: hypothetical protein PLW34_09040 [Termitinemataceae bacterium]|nr:hypothetical protein [Termitinemataceae bacterium]HOM23793.1 hypothetical protein [Termitinemataceae bacterium]HPQ00870.1 hypothetical protein [Termitinemataceae bacterium]